ncbi:MAG: hypothetical protein WB809_03625 [Thermoplasmata archaeon]
MTANRRPPTPSGLVLVLLLAALAVGAAASIVAAARTANSPPLGGTTPIPEVYLSDDLVIIACIVLFLAIVVPIVYDRIRGGASVPGRVIVVTLVIVLAMVLFVVVARFATAPGGPFATGQGNTGIPGNNSTGTSTNLTGPSNPLLGNGGNISFLGGHIPGWVVFPVIAVFAVLIAVVAVPRARLYLQDRAVARLAQVPEAESVRGALGHAAQELAAGSDPRSVILRLYGQLLLRVGPLAGDIDRSTPEEIRSLHLVRVGIRPEAAEALTRLFEEARYSTHALGPEAAGRASRAIADAERDLARAAPLP